jgi:hypothetical protein
MGSYIFYVANFPPQLFISRRISTSLMNTPSQKININSVIHLVVCLTTGPKPLPKRALRIVRSRASSFKREYPLLSLRSSNSFLLNLNHSQPDSVFLHMQKLVLVSDCSINFRVHMCSAGCRIITASCSLNFHTVQWLSHESPAAIARTRSLPLNIFTIFIRVSQ